MEVSQATSRRTTTCRCATSRQMPRYWTGGMRDGYSTSRTTLPYRLCGTASPFRTETLRGMVVVCICEVTDVCRTAKCRTTHRPTLAAVCAHTPTRRSSTARSATTLRPPMAAACTPVHPQSSTARSATTLRPLMVAACPLRVRRSSTALLAIIQLYIPTPMAAVCTHTTPQ